MRDRYTGRDDHNDRRGWPFGPGTLREGAEGASCGPQADQLTLESEDGEMGIEFTFPRCRKCGAGDLVPLSDFGSQGAPIQFKAWVCTNPNCLYNIKFVMATSSSTSQ